MKNPLVVGYRGEIGSYILDGLIKYMPSAVPIMCFDTHEKESEKIARIKKADVIFLCVPITETENWLIKYQKHLSYTNKIIIEQTSLKGFIFHRPRTAACGYRVLSMHILFRPSATPNKEDRTIVVIEDKAWKSIRIFSFLYEGLKVSQVVTLPNWKSHDQEMALQQALVHRVLLILGSLLEEQGATQTYISKKVVELKNRICKGDPEMYHIIQQNVFLDTFLSAFNSKTHSFKLSDYMKSKKG